MRQVPSADLCHGGDGNAPLDAGADGVALGAASDGLSPEGLRSWRQHGRPSVVGSSLFGQVKPRQFKRLATYSGGLFGALSRIVASDLSGARTRVVKTRGDWRNVPTLRWAAEEM
jgi:hypothetical protein